MQPFGENTSNIPAFLGKLWKMVNDPNTDHLICWSMAGNSFVIQNQAQFWYELLPLYYKHNNMSSFVRQLNMYGFHKMSTVENGTMDADKDEIQFYHRFFQKGQPELLRNIKRKVTVSKTENNVQNIIKNEDIAKVLTDVKQLRGRQTSVDTQLTAMKQENAVLWRELAMLRQKHMKQQQIVNKLIQFLVTLVNPSQPTRMGVGVKRRMPLMLHESPNIKKAKTKKSSKSDSVDNGPTIHELDSEIEITPDELFDQDIDDPGMVKSPNTESSQPSSVSSNEGSSGDSAIPENFWDKPEFVLQDKNVNGYRSSFTGGYSNGPILPNQFSAKEINHLNSDDLLVTSDFNEESLSDLQQPQNSSNEKVFLNPNTRDTLLTDLVNGNYNNTDVLNGKNGKRAFNNINGSLSNNNPISNENIDMNPDTTVATRDLKINNGSTPGTNKCSRDDLDLHLESAQTEIDNLKDILHGCTALDANTLLGVCGIAPYEQLFNDDPPTYGPNFGNGDLNKNSLNSAADPMVSGTELTTCGIDFNELFDETLDQDDSSHDLPHANIKAEPRFSILDQDL